MKLPALIPDSYDSAIDALVAALDTEERAHILARKDEGASHHMFLGMAIRNAWVHPEGSPLTAYFVQSYGLGCPDDISTMLLRGLWAKVRGDAYDERERRNDARHYQEFWARQGVDPITLQVVESPLPATPLSLWGKIKREVTLIRRWWGS